MLVFFFCESFTAMIDLIASEQIYIFVNLQEAPTT